MPLRFSPKESHNNMPAPSTIMAQHRICDEPLSDNNGLDMLIRIEVLMQEIDLITPTADVLGGFIDITHTDPHKLCF